MNDIRQFSISVVIPSYNMASLLPRAIDSAASQSYKPLEIIVVDDGSTDHTAEALEEMQKQFPLLRCITQQNMGNAGAKNTGIAAAQGDWIAFLDADDKWLPNRLGDQVDILAANPEVCWAGSAYERVRVTEGVDRVCGALRVGADVSQSTKKIFDALPLIAGPTSLWIGTVLIRKDALVEQNLFDSRLRGCDDTDLWVRFALAYPKIGFSKKPGALYTVAQLGSMTALAASKIEPTRFIFFSKLQSYVAHASKEWRNHCQAILIRELSTYVKSLTRTGNPSAAREVVSWARSENMPAIPLKYRLLTWVPPIVIRYVRMIWKSLPGKNG